MEKTSNKMTQIGNVIPKNSSSVSSTNHLKRFHNVGGKTIQVVPHDDLKKLVKIAYSKGVATMEWKEAGLYLLAVKDEDGNVVIRKSLPA